jgi:hypothetical protein
MDLKTSCYRFLRVFDCIRPNVVIVKICFMTLSQEFGRDSHFKLDIDSKIWNMISNKRNDVDAVIFYGLSMYVFICISNPCMCTLFIRWLYRHLVGSQKLARRGSFCNSLKTMHTFLGSFCIIWIIFWGLGFSMILLLHMVWYGLFSGMNSCNLSQNRQFFSENILKIITLVPGQRVSCRVVFLLGFTASSRSLPVASACVRSCWGRCIEI